MQMNGHGDGDSVGGVACGETMGSGRQSCSQRCPQRPHLVHTKRGLVQNSAMYRLSAPCSLNCLHAQSLVAFFSPFSFSSLPMSTGKATAVLCPLSLLLTKTLVCHHHNRSVCDACRSLTCSRQESHSFTRERKKANGKKKQEKSKTQFK